jgi:hypothetical protein
VEDAWCRLRVWTGLPTPLLTVEGELEEVVARDPGPERQGDARARPPACRVGASGRKAGRPALFRRVFLQIGLPALSCMICKQRMLFVQTEGKPG